MALRLRPWAAPAAFTIAALAAGYVVTRSAEVRLDARRLPAPSGADEDVTLATLRWRAVDAELTVDRYRLVLAPEFRASEAENGPSIALTADAPDSLRGTLDSLFRPALARHWHDLGLGVTKVGVGVVVEALVLAPRDSTARTPPPGSAGLYWILPDTSARTSCVAVIPIWSQLLQSLQHGSIEDRASWLGSGLGPCELMARYGAPGPRVRRWLERRGYDLASATERGAGEDRSWLYFYLFTREPVLRWWWPALHQLRPTTLGCLGGEEEACRKVIAEGDGRPSWDSLLTLVPQPRAGGFSEIGLVDGEHFLHDVAAAAGPQRFQEFWITDLPVDSALTLALGEPVGRWTAAWQRRSLPRPPIGPEPAVADVGLSLLVIGAGLLVTTLFARRRTVR